jgi:hypothetical protein
MEAPLWATHAVRNRCTGRMEAGRIWISHDSKGLIDNQDCAGEATTARPPRRRRSGPNIGGPKPFGFYQVLQGSTGFCGVRSFYRVRRRNLAEPNEPGRTSQNPVEPSRTWVVTRTAVRPSDPGPSPDGPEARSPRALAEPESQDPSAGTAGRAGSRHTANRPASAMSSPKQPGQ